MDKRHRVRAANRILLWMDQRLDWHLPTSFSFAVSAVVIVYCTVFDSSFIALCALGGLWILGVMLYQWQQEYGPGERVLTEDHLETLASLASNNPNVADFVVQAANDGLPLLQRDLDVAMEMDQIRIRENERAKLQKRTNAIAATLVTSKNEVS